MHPWRPSFALGTVVAAITFAPSCTKTEEVTFVLKVPGEVRDSTQWLEVGAYGVGTCPSIAQLSGGLPRGGVVQRVGFQNGDKAPVFRVDKGTYAFAASARNTQCEVLAAGCTAIEVPGSSEITINLREATTKGGKCPSGSACKNAECVPSPTTETIGEGCTLEVVGAGPLEALTSGAQSVSMPVIAAVTDGFIMAYSQFDEKIHTTTLKVSFDGGWVNADETTPLPFNRYSIPGACPDDVGTIGLGLNFDLPNSQAGLVIVPRSPKCSQSAMSIFSILPNGHFAQAPGISPGFEAAADTNVMSNHPLGFQGYLVNVVNGQTYLRTVTAGGVSQGGGQTLGGETPHKQAWVAASRRMVAVLVQSANSSTSEPTKLPDGGTAPSTGGDAPELRLQMASLQDAANTFSPDPLRISGQFGALAVQDARAVVLSSGGLDAPVQYSLANLGDSVFTTASVPVEGEGKPLNADVALVGDRMYIAMMLSNGISVLAFDGFSGTPKPIKQKPLGRDFRVKNFMGGIFDELRDGYVAIAAIGPPTPRVGVVWMTGSRIAAGEELGGWAVLACK